MISVKFGHTEVVKTLLLKNPVLTFTEKVSFVTFTSVLYHVYVCMYTCKSLFHVEWMGTTYVCCSKRIY